MPEAIKVVFEVAGLPEEHHIILLGGLNEMHAVLSLCLCRYTNIFGRMPSTFASDVSTASFC